MPQRAALAGPLTPPSMEASAKPYGRLPFGFGPRFYFALIVGLVWLVPAWWSPRLIEGLVLWDLIALAVWLADLLRLPAPDRFRARRLWSAPLLLGRASSAHIQIRHSGDGAVRALLTDETPVTLSDAPPEIEAVVRGDGWADASYSVLPKERGDMRQGRLFFRYRGPLGFAERWAVADLSQIVRVLPDLGRAGQYALYLIRSRQVEMGRRTKRQRGMGREFDSLRDYRDGDDVRDISWAATARRRQLTTRVYQLERSQTVWIVVDAGRLLRAKVNDAERAVAVSKLDYAVDAALSLAQVASQFGDRVGLVAYGRSIQQSAAPARGPGHVRALVDALAQVRPEALEADHARAARALLRMQSRRSLVVWLTDFAETATTPEVIEYALQMTQRHLVMFAAMTQPDLIALAKASPQSEDEMFRHAAAVEVMERRELLLRRMRERGVLAIDLAPNALAERLVNQYLEIKDRAML